MLNLKSIVHQLKKEDYDLLLANLKENNAEKFSQLLCCMKENVLTEKQMAEKLMMNISTYYTLKSRLYKRIQDFLSSRQSTSKTDIMHRVAAIPVLVYDTPRDTALALLNKLEKDLAGHDLPHELTSVYGAQKKLRINSPKYYEYEQLYNRHVAYTLALDKAQDTLAGFIKKLGEWHVSKDPVFLELLRIIKNEMTALCRLYDSHHMTVYKNLLDISFALYVPLPEAVKNDEPLPDLLSATEKIVTSYPHDSTYSYLHKIVGLLWFEYYHKLNETKKEEQYYAGVRENIATLLNYNFSCFASAFLISRNRKYIQAGMQGQLYDENRELFRGHVPDREDVPNYLLFYKSMAVGAFYKEKYQEAAALLNELLNNLVFKNLVHSEVEIKLFLVLCQSFQNKYETAHTLLKSAARKVREMDKSIYPHVPVFVKMLSLQMDSAGRGREEKLRALRDRFMYLNRGTGSMFEYLPMDDAFIARLSRNIK